MAHPPSNPYNNRRPQEFAEEAEVFKDISRSFLLQDLVCGFCSHCRDLELCRDER